MHYQEDKKPQKKPRQSKQERGQQRGEPNQVDLGDAELKRRPLTKSLKWAGSVIFVGIATLMLSAFFDREPLAHTDAVLAESETRSHASLCPKTGELVTLQGSIFAQSVLIADGTGRNVQLLIPSSPVCISRGGIGESDRTVNLVQIVGAHQPYTEEVVTVRGTLTSGNLGPSFAVPTALRLDPRHQTVGVSDVLPNPIHIGTSP